MTLSIIIVSWNVKDLLRECLASIFANTDDLALEVFVVDNASSDDSAKMAAQEFPQVHLIINDFNAGFARANNQAIRQASGQFILLLNPDMRVLPNALSGMVKFMEEHLEVGVAGCHLVNEKGETVPQARRFPTVWDQAAIILKLPHLWPGILSKYLMKDFNYDAPAQAVDTIRGSFFMIRREVVDKIGGLDERYFVWFEEVDYCRQVWRAGWKVFYNPVVKCVDYVGQSFRQRETFWKQRQFTKSMLQYFKKWQPWWQWAMLAILRPIGLVMTL